MSSVISLPWFAEPFSSISHLVGAALFAVLSFYLIRRAHSFAGRLSLIIFAVSTVGLLSISGVYHLLDPIGRPSAVMRRLDHAFIFVLIASSFTPTHTILFRGFGRWGMLTAIWTMAAVSILLKMIYFHEMPPRVGLAMYLGMGWLGLFTGVSLWRRYGFGFTAPILWGGIAYSLGGILEALHWPVLIPGVVQWHELFHVFVLIGLGFHWGFIFSIADESLDPHELLTI